VDARGTNPFECLVALKISDYKLETFKELHEIVKSLRMSDFHQRSVVHLKTIQKQRRLVGDGEMKNTSIYRDQHLTHGPLIELRSCIWSCSHVGSLM